MGITLVTAEYHRGMMNETPAETRQEAEEDERVAEISIPELDEEVPVTQHWRSVGPTQ